MKRILWIVVLLSSLLLLSHTGWSDCVSFRMEHLYNADNWNYEDYIYVTNITNQTLDIMCYMYSNSNAQWSLGSFTLDPGGSAYAGWVCCASSGEDGWSYSVSCTCQTH